MHERVNADNMHEVCRGMKTVYETAVLMLWFSGEVVKLIVYNIIYLTYNEICVIYNFVARVM